MKFEIINNWKYFDFNFIPFRIIYDRANIVYEDNVFEITIMSFGFMWRY
jgi:hypothetical protein